MSFFYFYTNHLDSIRHKSDTPCFEIMKHDTTKKGQTDKSDPL